MLCQMLSKKFNTVEINVQSVKISWLVKSLDCTGVQYVVVLFIRVKILIKKNLPVFFCGFVIVKKTVVLPSFSLDTPFGYPR
jgi:hypothetical protein